MINPLGSSGPRDPRLPEGSGEVRKSDKPAAGGAESKSPVSGKDEVRLSSAAQDLQTVKDHLGDKDAARAEKTRRLKEQIDAGTYKPDAAAVAQKLIQSEF